MNRVRIRHRALRSRADQNLIAKGLVGVGSSMLRQVAGRHTSEVGGEVIHRDDLVMLV